MSATVMEHPIAGLVRAKLMSPARVQAALGMPRHRWYRLMRCEVELTASEAAKAVELFGVELRELLP